MEYAVEFEIQLDRGETPSVSVYNALLSSFGSITKFRILPIETYIGYIKGNEPIIWREVCSTPLGSIVHD